MRSAGRWLAVIALLAALTAAYWPVLWAGFSPWDDRLYIADNPLVQNGLTSSALVASFCSTWENNWAPVFWIFLAFQVSLAGVASAAVFHAISVFLCILNAGLLGWVARRFSISFAAVVVVVALFAVHPLRVEAVAWISAQKHLLAGALLLVSLLFYQEESRNPSGRCYLLSLLAFGLSLMSSQIGVGLPVFLFLWESGRGGVGFARWKEALRKAAGFVLLAIGASAITLWVNWRVSAQAVAWFDHPLPHRIGQAFGSLGWQAQALLWPAGLAGFYPWPSQLIWLHVSVGILVLLGIAWLMWRFQRSEPLIAAGLGGFIACFFPVSGFLALPVEFTADRLSYVPSLFLALASCAVVDRVLRRGRRWPVYACGIWAVTLVPLTFWQAGYWRNEHTIVDRTLSLYPDSIPAQLNEATLAGMEGKTEEALSKFQKIRQSHPLYEVVWANEMALLLRDGHQLEAAELGKGAVLHIPRSLPLNYKVGVLLSDLGRPAEAVPYLRRARELSPQGVQPAFQLARALVGSGEIKEAIPLLELLELSMQGEPDYWELRYEAHDRNGDWQKAAKSKEAAQTLRSRQKSAP